MLGDDSGDERAARATWLRVLAALPLLLGAVHVAFFVYVVVQRFRHPVELEWMSGGVFDHVERVMQGKPIYVAPSVEFIPFLYPPLFYGLSATLAPALTIPAACRVVSIAATCATAYFAHRASKRLGATRFWALVGTALFVGAYSVVGYWYDLERSDSLLMALLTGALVVLLESQGLFGAAIAGAILGGAFLAKQPASVVLASAFVGLLLARKTRRALALAGGGAAILVPAVLVLNARTHGWFWFYVVKMPSAHGVTADLLTTFFILDATKVFALAGVTGVVIVPLVSQLIGRAIRSVRGRAPAIEENNAVFGAMLAGAFVASVTSRLHVGGYLNVLVYWTTFATIAFAVVATRLSTSGPAVKGIVLGIAALQLGHLLYDPAEASSSARRAEDARIVEARIRELEKKGTVLVPGRCHLSSTRHFHAVALMDVMRGGLPIPEELVTGLRERRYAAYVLDEFGELTLEAIVGKRSELFEHVTRHYFVAQRFDDREPPPIVGWIAHPSWVLRPRREPLTEMSVDGLFRRQLLERGIAEMRMRAQQAGAPSLGDGDDIEDLAAAIDQGTGR